MDRGYQKDYSSLHPERTFDPTIRLRKVRTIVTILQDCLGGKLRECKLLDVGCAAGFLSYHLADQVRHVTGIDIDERAVSFAKERHCRPNLNFLVADAMQMKFPDASFDLVTCVQIYEHVPDAAQLFREIFRVLKPGGFCYLAATNRLDLWEHHYHLPFLSVIPRSWGHWYLRLSGKGTHYYEKHLTYWTLRRYVKDFELIDYTDRCMNEPRKFMVDYIVNPGTLKTGIARLILNHAYWLFPSYIWLLKKPGSPSKEASAAAGNETAGA